MVGKKARKMGSKKISNSKQKRLLREIKEITKNDYLDPQKIIDDADDNEEANIRLELAKDRLIRIVIISDYVLVNEQLDTIICNYFFGKKTTWSPKSSYAIM